VWDGLTWLTRREGFAVVRGDCGQGGGVTMWAARRIRVQSSLRSPARAPFLRGSPGAINLPDSVLSSRITVTGCPGKFEEPSRPRRCDL
jgi:hypothetical protein